MRLGSTLNRAPSYGLPNKGVETWNEPMERLYPYTSSSVVGALRVYTQRQGNQDGVQAKPSLCFTFHKQMHHPCT